MEERDCTYGQYAMNSLMKAAHTGDPRQLDIALSSSDCALDTINHIGQTALMIACARGHLSIAARLAREGSDLDMVDLQGRRAVDIAEQHGHRDIMDVLQAEDAKQQQFKQSMVEAAGGGKAKVSNMAAASAQLNKLLAEGGINSKEAPF